jgi:hypothetical protein
MAELLLFVVPEAGFEPARLSTTVFETAASAVPPLGRRNELYPILANSSAYVLKCTNALTNGFAACLLAARLVFP